MPTLDSSHRLIVLRRKAQLEGQRALLRTPLENGSDASNLVEDQAIFGVGFQQFERLQNLEQTNLQVFFPCLEEGPLALCPRDSPGRKKL
jgi:hypothetical protein